MQYFGTFPELDNRSIVDLKGKILKFGVECWHDSLILVQSETSASQTIVLTVYDFQQRCKLKSEQLNLLWHGQ